MAGLNQVFLMGNVTRDPQLKQLPNDVTLADFGFATNRRYRTAAGEDREEVCFVDCTAFGKQAEVLHQYAQKGKPLFIQGRLRFETWDDKSGSKRSKLSVTVENFQFIGGKDGSGSFEGAAAENEKAERHGREPAAVGAGAAGEERPRRRRPERPFGGEKQFNQADIPF